MDEKEASLLKSSSLKAIWDSNDSDDKASSTNHAESIWNPLSTPLAGTTEPKATVQAAPKILTLEELERRLAGHHVAEEEDEVTNLSRSDKSTLSTSSDDTTQPLQEQSEEQESSGLSDIISSPIVVSPIRVDFTHGQGRILGARPPLIPFAYPPHMMKSNYNPRMPPFRHPLPGPPPGFHPMHSMWQAGGPRGPLMHPPMPLPHGMLPPNYFFRREISWDGFMTQKEKDFILKIQFFQLQSKDASIDDYYYQNYLVRKKAKQNDATSSPDNNGEVTDESSKMIIPSITRDEKVYQPAEFKDSLGKLKVSSLSNPRQTIDVDMNFESETTDRSMNSKDIARKRKTQLGALEKMYQLLLEIEDYEKKALALPEQDRDTLKTSKTEMISTLFKQCKLKELSEVWKRNDDSYFKELLYYRKGKRLFSRVVPILPQELATIIVFSVMRNITAIIRRDEKDMVLVELSKSFCGVVEKSSLSILCQLLNALLKGPPQANPHIPAVVMAAKSKFGENVLIKILQKGQLLCKETSSTEVTSSSQKWNQGVTELFCIVSEHVKLIPECLLKELAQCSVHFQPNGHDQSN